MVFEPPAFVAGLHDLAVMGEAIEERCRHFGIAEDAGPFGEGEIGGDDDGRALVKPADQVEEKLPAGLGEGQIAELVQHDKVESGQIIRMRPWRPARVSLSSRLTRSTTL
jgi:hypothetical protein